ncbi:MAG: hypothetical protein WCF65_03690 [Parachlamydiaceae bacterium]
MNYNIQFRPFVDGPDRWERPDIRDRLINLANTRDVRWIRNDFLGPNTSFFGSYVHQIFQSLESDLNTTRDLLSRLHVVVMQDPELYPLFLQAVHNFRDLTGISLDYVVYFNSPPSVMPVPVYYPRFESSSWWNRTFFPQPYAACRPLTSHRFHTYPAARVVSAATPQVSPSGHVTVDGRVLPEARTFNPAATSSSGRFNTFRSARAAPPARHVPVGVQTPQPAFRAAPTQHAAPGRSGFSAGNRVPPGTRR